MYGNCTHEPSVLKKLIAHTKIVALHAAALGLRDWHLTHRGVAMIFFAKPILNSQLSHTISTSLAYIFSFSSVWWVIYEWMDWQFVINLVYGPSLGGTERWSMNIPGGREACSPGKIWNLGHLKQLEMRLKLASFWYLASLWAFPLILVAQIELHAVHAAKISSARTRFRRILPYSADWPLS